MTTNFAIHHSLKDIWTHVFSFLEHDQVLRCRLVCSDCNLVVSHNYYWRQFLDASSKKVKPGTTIYSYLGQLEDLSRVKVAHPSSPVEIVQAATTNRNNTISSQDNANPSSQCNSIHLKQWYIRLKKRHWYLTLLDRMTDIVAFFIPMSLFVTSLLITLWLAYIFDSGHPWIFHQRLEPDACVGASYTMMDALSLRCQHHYITLYLQKLIFHSNLDRYQQYYQSSRRVWTKKDSLGSHFLVCTLATLTAAILCSCYDTLRKKFSGWKQVTHQLQENNSLLIYNSHELFSSNARSFQMLYEPTSTWKFHLRYIASRFLSSHMYTDTRALFSLACYIWVPTLTLMLIYKFTLFPGLTFRSIASVPAILFCSSYVSTALIEHYFYHSRQQRQHFGLHNSLLVLCSGFCAFGTGTFLDYWLQEADVAFSWKGSLIVIGLWTFHVFIKMGILQLTWSAERRRMTFFQQLLLGIDNICSVVISVWCLTISVQEILHRHS